MQQGFEKLLGTAAMAGNGLRGAVRVPMNSLQQTVSPPASGLKRRRRVHRRYYENDPSTKSFTVAGSKRMRQYGFVCLIVRYLLPVLMVETTGGGASNRRWTRAGSVCGCVRRTLRLSGSFRDIDAAFEVRTVLNHDAARFDVAYQLRFFLDVDLVRRFDVALNGAVDHNFASFQPGMDTPVGANGEAMFVALDRAFHLAIDGQIFTAENLSFTSHSFRAWPIRGAIRAFRLIMFLWAMT